MFVTYVALRLKKHFWKSVKVFIELSGLTYTFSNRPAKLTDALKVYQCELNA